MHASRLTRRASLLLPFLLAACGGGRERREFPPLRYSYLPPIRLNVASIDIQQRFYPSGVAPDITDQAPIHPVEALRMMAQDRLQALGTSGTAVVGITDASLTRRDDVITCALAVMLEIYSAPEVRAGYAQASVTRQHTGPVDDLRGTLYDLTKAAMDAMNVELEYQIRNNLAAWLVSAAPAPVEQAPLQGAPGAPPPEGTALPTPAAPAAPAPAAGAPVSLQPPGAAPAGQGTQVLVPPPAGAPQH